MAFVESRSWTKRGSVGTSKESRGPAIVPGDLSASLLLAAVRHKHPQLRMPPDGKLSLREIADLERWIALGAPDPREETSEGASGAGAADLAAAREHWAYRPVRRPQIPEVQDLDWASTAADRLILARLEAAELAPLPPADRSRARAPAKRPPAHGLSLDQDDLPLLGATACVVAKSLAPGVVDLELRVSAPHL